MKIENKNDNNKMILNLGNNNNKNNDHKNDIASKFITIIFFMVHYYHFSEMWKNGTCSERSCGISSITFHQI